MDFIKSNNYSIFFSDLGYKRLKNLILLNKYSKIFVHVDTNTKNYCLDIFIKKTNGLNFDIIESVPGEENKNLESCINLWSIISRKSGDRKSLIINLGGGVVSDIGGFVASTFKRGIDYINIPTTLLSIVDASIGGKTGIDFQFLKNQIGTFYEPKMVVVDPIFIKTLSKNEVLSGYAEIFKHSLIVKSKLFEKLIKVNRVTKVNKGGKKLAFRAFVIVGDQKGTVGLATSKSKEVPLAIKRSIEKAKKNMHEINVTDGTIPHRIVGEFKASKVVLRPAPEGTGVIAGGSIRILLESLGIENVVAKSIGSNNSLNMAKAALNGLLKLKKQ